MKTNTTINSTNSTFYNEDLRPVRFIDSLCCDDLDHSASAYSLVNRSSGVLERKVTDSALELRDESI